MLLPGYHWTVLLVYSDSQWVKQVECVNHDGSQHVDVQTHISSQSLEGFPELLLLIVFVRLRKVQGSARWRLYTHTHKESLCYTHTHSYGSALDLFTVFISNYCVHHLFSVALFTHRRTNDNKYRTTACKQVSSCHR